MKLPDQYKNLTLEEKRIVVANLIMNYGDNWAQDLIKGLWDSQVEFLFTYFFTESKTARERMWHDMQAKYEATLKQIEYIVERIQRLNIEYSELLQKRDEIESMANLDEQLKSS